MVGIRLVLCALSAALVVALMTSRPAAAMDCGQAKTAIERTICGDAALKAQDAALSRFYFNTLRRLRGDRHELLIADQRHWLAEQRACEWRKGTAESSCLAKALAERQRSIAICFSGAGMQAEDGAACPIFEHAGCPKVIATASPRLMAYPWLIDQTVDDARRNVGNSNCQPTRPDEPGSPNDNETEITITLVAERPGLVALRYESNGMSRGAAHPSHDARLVTYDTRAKAEVRLSALMPALTRGSQLLAKMDKVAELSIDAECCGDDDNRSFQSLGLDSAPMPSGWAPGPRGGLVLGFVYYAYGRDFLATARLPRPLFIDAVDPKYVTAFPQGP